MSGSGSGEMQKPTLLAPIRNYEGVVGVIRAGADEVYCGVTIRELRNFFLSRGYMCEIPSYDELDRIVKYAHNHGVDVLLTVNERFMAEVIEKNLRNHVRSCLNKEVDAIIVGNLGIFQMIKDIDDSVPIYASTYHSSMNDGTVDLLKKVGFSRVILERPLTIPEISEIVRNSKVDIEIFIHGPACSNFEIDCYQFHYSEYPPMREAILTIDGIQYPCLLPFEVYDVNGNKMLDNTRIMDALEFCSLCLLPEIMKTGVAGFKIVDRCADEEYQEQTTKIYRKFVDMIAAGHMEKFEEELESSMKNFIPFPRNLPLLNLKELCCEQKRCYYSPLFRAQYKNSVSWRTWTKNQLKFTYNPGAGEE